VRVKKSGRIRQGNKQLKATLFQYAWAVTRTKNIYLSVKYSSTIARKGKKKALIIVGHKILCAIYHIISTGECYKDLGKDYLEQQIKHKRIAYLKGQLRELEQVV
jgi:transposase